MTIRNNHWYNLNEQRDYPIDDTASALSDSGDRLPAALLADLRLRWPITYGKYAFVSSASVTPHLVTFLIEATDDLDNSPSSSVLIAGVTIPKTELVTGRTYALEVFKPRVGGFVTIGSGSEQIFKGLFSTPRQTLLTARAARHSRLPPIPSLGVEQAAVPLTGIVNLTAVAPLKLTKTSRVIAGVEYDNVLVFSLVEEAAGVNTGANTPSVFSEFAGPCGKRVGSRSCNDPQPIETINTVKPDCNGVITLEFQGCATVGRNTVDCGIVIDCELGLSTSCDPPYLPNLTTGELPSETAPIIITPPLPPEPPVIGDVSISETIETILTLPYCDKFDDGIAYGFSPIGISLFGFIADDSPEEGFCCVGSLQDYGCDTSQSLSNSLSGGFYTVPILEVASSYGTVSASAQSRTNISLFTTDIQTLYRKYTTDVKITAGQVGSQKNAGVVINYTLLPSSLTTYFVSLLNLDTSVFGIYFFNGNSFITILEITVLDMHTDDWYRISFKAVPSLSQTSINMVATLNGITDPSISVTINTSVTANLWSADSAKAGLYAKRSRSYFSFWRIDEALA